MNAWLPIIVFVAASASLGMVRVRHTHRYIDIDLLISFYKYMYMHTHTYVYIPKGKTCSTPEGQLAADCLTGLADVRERKELAVGEVTSAVTCCSDLLCSCGRGWVGGRTSKLIIWGLNLAFRNAREFFLVISGGLVLVVR